MIVAIDFDGTIVEGEYPTIKNLMPDALECITELAKDNYIIINTCRSNEHLLTAINYLLEEGIPFHRVNDNHPGQTKFYNNNSRKIFAPVYVDESNVFGFKGWKEVTKEIQRMSSDKKTELFSEVILGKIAEKCNK